MSAAGQPVGGVVFGVVTNVDDPEGMGRIKVRFPWLSDSHETDWIRIATVMAGNGRGSFFMPEVDDEVLVAFEQGEARFPVVVGFVWNGPDRTPAQHVRDRIFRSKNGHQIRFLDATPVAGSQGALVVQDGHGNRIVMSNGKIVIQSTAILEFVADSVSFIIAGSRRNVAPTGGPV